MYLDVLKKMGHCSSTQGEHLSKLKLGDKMYIKYFALSLQKYALCKKSIGGFYKVFESM